MKALSKCSLRNLMFHTPYFAFRTRSTDAIVNCAKKVNQQIFVVLTLNCIVADSIQHKPYVLFMIDHFADMLRGTFVEKYAEAGTSGTACIKFRNANVMRKLNLF